MPLGDGKIALYVKVHGIWRYSKKRFDCIMIKMARLFLELFEQKDPAESHEYIAIYDMGSFIMLSGSDHKY